MGNKKYKPETLRHISETVKNIREDQGEKMLLPGEK